MPAAVVADGPADIVGHAGKILQQVIEASPVQFRMLVERGIQVGDIRLMMLPVMNLHRLGVDVRFEGRRIIRQRWKCVSHVCATSRTAECVDLVSL